MDGVIYRFIAFRYQFKCLNLEVSAASPVVPEDAITPVWSGRPGMSGRKDPAWSGMPAHSGSSGLQQTDIPNKTWDFSIMRQLLQSRYPERSRRMRIIDHRVKRIGGECRGIVLIKFNQGMHEITGRGMIGCIFIRLEFMFS